MSEMQYTVSVGMNHSLPKYGFFYSMNSYRSIIVNIPAIRNNFFWISPNSWLPPLPVDFVSVDVKGSSGKSYS